MNAIGLLLLLAQTPAPPPTARLAAIDVTGAARMGQDVVVRASGLDVGALLTPDGLRRAERRVVEIPALGKATFRVTPAAGASRVRIAVVERDVLPANAVGWSAVAVRSLFARELRVDVAGLAKAGELISPAYRWAANRPGVSVDLQAPSPAGLPGVTTFSASWERAAYAPAVAGDPFVREERTRVGGGLSDWATSWLRWQAGAAYDRIDGQPFAAVEGHVNVRLFNDRVAVLGGVSHWTPTGDASSFTNGQALMMWRSTSDATAPTLTVTAGAAAASEQAPLAAWPSAGSSSVRGELLRGHTLFKHGIIVVPVFGRRLAFGNVEYERVVVTRGSGSLSSALFLDAAQAFKRASPLPASDLDVDVGAGIRLSAAGLPGKVRVDVAIGLRDGSHKISAGYAALWGRTRFTP